MTRQFVQLMMGDMAWLNLTGRTPVLRCFARTAGRGWGETLRFAILLLVENVTFSGPIVVAVWYLGR